MARKQLTAGYGSRHRERSSWPRKNSIAACLELLEERRLLSGEPSAWEQPSSWEQALAELEPVLLFDASAVSAAPIVPLPELLDVPVAEPAVIDASGTSTTTAASLLAYGGPGDPNLPGFNNVGKGSTGNSTVVYLGNRWVITAAHVTIDNQFGPIRFGSLTYQVDMTSFRVLKNPNGTNADLKLFRLTTDPGLPSILSDYLATQAPSRSDHTIMIGNGYSPGVEKFWRVTTTTSPWTWTEQSAPATPGPTDLAGWSFTTNRAIRWGDNRVKHTGMFISTGAGSYVQAFTTEFSSLKYTSEAAQPYESQATSGDSGGAVFLYQNGRWVLGGIMIAISPAINGQPGYTALYGGLTYMADLSYYRNEILGVINPAPIASITGPSSVLNGESAIFTVSAQDTSDDMSAGFRFEIDWGDNSPVQIVNNAVSANVPHTFARSGQLTVRVTAFDQGNQGSLPATTIIQVDAVRLVPNADNPALTDLIWAGTPGADQVYFQQIGDSNTIRAYELMLNGVATSNVREISGVTGRLIAYGQEGDDTLDARGMGTKPVTLNGNAGNNTLYGGAGGDLLIGGSNGAEGAQGSNVIIAGNGNNTIYGNETVGRKYTTGGNNLIIGGTGQDTIYGNFGSNTTTGGEGGQNLVVGNGGADVIYASQVIDGAEGGKGSILISGSTLLTQSALQSVLAEWTSTHTYAQKLANIQGTGGLDRFNGDDFLQVGVTVFADASVDEVYSDTKGQWNWLLLSLGQDLTYRLKIGDSLTDLV